jgi:hypothetical protein
MKTIYRLFLLLALPFLTPTLSKANGIGDRGTVDHNPGRDREIRMERHRFERAEEAKYLREHYGAGDQEGPRAPLDGGISLLLAAGIGLGVKKAAQRKKARKENAIDVAG